MQRLSTKYDFSIEVCERETIVTMWKIGDPTNGRIFKLMSTRFEGIHEHMCSLTDQLFQDFMKTAQPLPRVVENQ